MAVESAREVTGEESLPATAGLPLRHRTQEPTVLLRWLGSAPWAV